MRRLLREPLLHFLVLGALLFGLYSWINRGAAAEADEIVVTLAQQQNLQLQFLRTRQRAPTPEELRGLVDNWVREEVLYREGLAMGLDRNDPVVRRRVGQKVEFIADGLTPNTPTEAELQAWLDAHSDRYTIEARYTLQQRYFDPARHGDRLQADIAAAQRALQAGKPVAGDSTMLPPALNDAAASEVRRAYGEELVAALQALPLGGWQGPLRSGFGLHLVRLDARVPARVATLADARAEVARDLLHARASEASATHYRRLLDRYSVRVEPADVAAAAATR
jgi:hypothetical protein